jgi:hypothetical protein
MMAGTLCSLRSVSLPSGVTSSYSIGKEIPMSESIIELGFLFAALICSLCSVSLSSRLARVGIRMRGNREEEGGVLWAFLFASLSLSYPVC